MNSSVCELIVMKGHVRHVNHTTDVFFRGAGAVQPPETLPPHMRTLHFGFSAPYTSLKGFVKQRLL